MRYNGTAIGVGICFFVVFWQTLDNLALGIGIGIALGAAIASTSAANSGSQQCNDQADPPSEADS